MTRVSFATRAPSGATSNACQVPHPMTGRGSPVEGMGLVSIRGIVAYSSRSATLGSTFAARRAGTYDARSATSTSSGTTSKNVRGS